MDHRTTLAEPPTAPAATVRADQAIFTSIRSPMGEGYRIVAASPGIRSDEKAEIIRRSPSHGSLCGNDENSFAMSAYPLPSGRYAICRSQHAGKEHTARGGYRVYTHILLLDQKDYLSTGCNPISLHHAMAQMMGDQPELKPPQTLDRFCLPISALLREQSYPPISKHNPIGPILRLSQSLLRGERVVVYGSGMDLEWLELVMISLPAAPRRTLSLTAGLNYCPARPSQLCFLCGCLEEAKRAMRGQALQWFHLDEVPAYSPARDDAWAMLLKQWFEAGRFSEIQQLTLEMTEKCAPAALHRIATICMDFDLAQTANSETLSKLTEKYNHFTPHNTVESKRLAQLTTLLESKQHANSN